eukprot:754532-Prymnesium_polylepis.1
MRWAVGCRIRLWWRLTDGSRAPFEATIEATRMKRHTATLLCKRRRRRYKLLFSDGDIRWSKLRSKRSRAE